VTRELPNIFPYIIVKRYIETFVKRWNHPSRQYFEVAKKELGTRINALIKLHFSQYTHGHLKQKITCVSRFLPAEVRFVDNRSGTYCKTINRDVPMLHHNALIP
jgi:hypothetical protein